MVAVIAAVMLEGKEIGFRAVGHVQRAGVASFKGLKDNGRKIPADHAWAHERATKNMVSLSVLI